MLFSLFQALRLSDNGELKTRKKKARSADPTISEPGTGKMLFGCLRHNINHSSENLKVIYIKCSMFYAIINCQFKTSEVGEANSSSLKALLEETANVHLCTILEIIFLEGGP